MPYPYSHTHSHRLTHTLTHWLIHSHTHARTRKRAHTETCIKSVSMFGWGIFGAVWKVEAVVRNCLLRWSGHLVEVPSTHLFDQSFFFKHISLFFCSDRIFPLVPSFSLLNQRFYMQKLGNFEPLYLNNESRFWKIKKVLLVQGLRNVSQKFQPSAVNRKYRKGQAAQLILLILFVSQQRIIILKIKECF